MCTYDTILVIVLFFSPVQDVPARPEGGVLVRQPSYWSAHTVSTYCEGRPELQPVPKGAGAGAARLNPDIITIIKQQQNRKRIQNTSITTTKKLSSTFEQRTSGEVMYYPFLMCVCVSVCVRARACVRVCVYGVCL